MHWRYEWVAALPQDVYGELVAMLNDGAAQQTPVDDLR